MKMHTLICLGILNLGLGSQSFAAPGELDLSFYLGSRINGDVNAIVPTADGKALIGGTFTTVSGGLRGGLARLNADGATDLTFLNGEQGATDWNSVNAVAVQRDGSILVAGGFKQFNGMTRSLIARVYADGALDLSFAANISGGNYPTVNHPRSAQFTPAALSTCRAQKEIPVSFARNHAGIVLKERSDCAWLK